MPSGSTKRSQYVPVNNIEDRSAQSKLTGNACHVKNMDTETAARDIQQCVILCCCLAAKYFNKNNNALRSSCKESDIFVRF